MKAEWKLCGDERATTAANIAAVNGQTWLLKSCRLFRRRLDAANWAVRRRAACGKQMVKSGRPRAPLDAFWIGLNDFGRKPDDQLSDVQSTFLPLDSCLSFIAALAAASCPPEHSFSAFGPIGRAVTERDRLPFGNLPDVAGQHPALELARDGASAADRYQSSPSPDRRNCGGRVSRRLCLPVAATSPRTSKVCA